MFGKLKSFEENSLPPKPLSVSKPFPPIKKKIKKNEINSRITDDLQGFLLKNSLKSIFYGKRL